MTVMMSMVTLCQYARTPLPFWTLAMTPVLTGNQGRSLLTQLSKLQLIRTLLLLPRPQHRRNQKFHNLFRRPSPRRDHPLQKQNYKPVNVNKNQRKAQHHHPLLLHLLRDQEVLQEPVLLYPPDHKERRGMERWSLQ